MLLNFILIYYQKIKKKFDNNSTQWRSMVGEAGPRPPPPPPIIYLFFLNLKFVKLFMFLNFLNYMYIFKLDNSILKN